MRSLSFRRTTEEEWALLQVHLDYCNCCPVALDEYHALADDVMPVPAAIASSDSVSTPETTSFSLDAAEQRLMSKLSNRLTDHRPHHRRNARGQIPAASAEQPAVGH
jgi:hypothetical protein